MKFLPNRTSSPYSIHPFIKNTLKIGLLMGSGVSKYIVKNMTRGLGSSVVRYTIKNKEISELNKEIKSLKKEIDNKNKTYYKIFSDSIHKINGNVKNIISPSLLISKNFIKNHPALSIIGGGMALYGLYHHVQKKDKAKQLQSESFTDKNI